MLKSNYEQYTFRFSVSYDVKLIVKSENKPKPKHSTSKPQVSGLRGSKNKDLGKYIAVKNSSVKLIAESKVNTAKHPLPFPCRNKICSGKFTGRMGTNAESSS